MSNAKLVGYILGAFYKNELKKDSELYKLAFYLAANLNFIEDILK